MGGISRTVRYKGNRMDIGGHRFFSKSDRVMNWWIEVMPVEASVDGAGTAPLPIAARHATSLAAPGSAPDPVQGDRVMLIRNRKSRIYFLRQFFDYPIKLSGDTLRKLGLLRTAKIGVSYAASMVNQKKPEKTLEQFLINRFGRELYLTFFKSYTEKVWGVPCDQISAEWGAQRIKGLSILKAVTHFLGTVFARKKGNGDLAQKGTETSLIEKFMYPKLGPGQLWEYVAEDVQRKGGCVETGWRVEKLLHRRVSHHGRRSRACGNRRAAHLRGRLLLFHHADQGTDARARCAGSRQRPRGQRRTHLPRLHHGRLAAE